MAKASKENIVIVPAVEAVTEEQYVLNLSRDEARTVAAVLHRVRSTRPGTRSPADHAAAILEALENAGLPYATYGGAVDGKTWTHERYAIADNDDMGKYQVIRVSPYKV